MDVYSISSYFPDCVQAFGATRGQEHIEPLLHLLETAATSQRCCVVLLDYCDIEYCTASYLKATIMWTLACGRLFATHSAAIPESDPSWAPRPFDVFPLVANLADDVSNELDDVLRVLRWPCLEALEWDAETVKRARVRGVLDPVLGRTLNCLTQEVSATASYLHERYPEENRITITGWNNRLADLYFMRLARRTKHGRQWIYEAVAEEVSGG